MRLLIHDFAGHPFAAQLSRVLAARGHTVVHGYCGGVTTGRGALATREGDPSRLDFVDVLSTPFERYSPIGRLRSEIAYGRALSSLVKRVRPDAVLSANSPLAAQALLWRTCRRLGIRRVYWLQDFLGRGTRAVLEERSALLGASVGRAWEDLETRLLRDSDHVVAIADDFRLELARRQVDTPTAVLENWTPIDEVTARGKDSEWSRTHGFADRPVALYSGTLGLKHDPEHLVAVARALAGADASLIVVTEGIGRDHLEARKAELGLDPLHLFDFVAYDLLPDVLGAADVCLVLLEPDAGLFSVPSKVLTYLAAGRAIVGAIPAENLAARTIERAKAGVVSEPGDHEGFARRVADLLSDPIATGRLGAAGRCYAEQAFDVDRIGDVIETVLTHS